TAKLPPDVRVHAPPGAANTLGDFQRHPLGETPLEREAALGAASGRHPASSSVAARDANQGIAAQQLRPQRASAQLVRLATVPIYRVDAVVRRSQPLQAHPLNRAPALRVHAEDAQALQLREGDHAEVNDAILPVVCDARVPRGCAWIEAGFDATAGLPPYGALLTIEKVAAP